MVTEVSSYQRNTQPYSCIGLIECTFPDGTSARGTCSLVGVNDILTATHVVYSPDHGGWADSYDFYFGADYNDITNQFDDYGFSYSPTWWTTVGWPDNTFTDGDNETMVMSEAKYDIAIIGVSEPIGDQLGWLGLNSGYNGNYSLNAIGYPSGAPGMMQEMANVQTDFYYQIYASSYDVMGPGSSGGPLLSENYVIGVKSTGMWWADVGTLYNAITDTMSSNDDLLTSVTSNASTSSTAISEGGNVTFTITRNGDISSPLTVYWGTQAGSASAGEGDYTNFGSTNTLYFAANQEIKIISINTLTDGLSEGAEYFYLNIYQNLSDANNFNYFSHGIAYIKDADLEAPTVLSFSPVDEGTAVSLSSNIVLTFNEAIARGTGNILLKTAAGVTMATYDAATSANLTLSGSNLTLNPSADLSAGTAYKVEFSAGSIKDLAGNAYAGTTSYNFSTSPSAADQIFSGTANNESFTGGTGNDNIDGGGGIDTAIYSVSRASFTLVKTNTGFMVQDSLGSEGIDTLANIERLQFADIWLALDLDPSQHTGQALEFIGLMAPALVKDPSIVGMILGYFDQGISLHDFCQLAIDVGLVNSIAGSTTDAALAAMAFRNVIGSEADAATIDMLVGYIDGRYASYTQAEFMTVIAGMEVNQTHIGLIGLQQTGVEFV